MVDLGLQVTSNMNERLAAVINSLSRSGEQAQRIAGILAGTSFDKKIISEQGIQYSDNEIARAKYLRDCIISLRKETDDTLFALNEYIARCSRRRKDGLTRVTSSKDTLKDWPVVEEGTDGSTETEENER